MKRKPNFIVIYCDDLGYGDLGCYGSETVRTPHLDQLAQDGTRFTDWYSNSPVCSPSRASLLTGRYPARAGVNRIINANRGKQPGLPASEMTMASWLKQQGYKTGLSGKWHLGQSPDTRPGAHGFEEFFGFMSGCIDYYSHIFYWQPTRIHHDLWENDDEVWRNGEYMTEMITEHATKFIQKNTEDPFFLFVAYNAPHYPMHAPQEYMDRYAHLPWDRQVMAAMISAVDDGVGTIVDTLKQAGLDEDTVIFFSSDNGPSSESRNWLDGTEDLYYGGSAGNFKGHKASLYDGGIKEPAILSCPARLPSGQVCSETGMMADIFPTFMELAGLPMPEDRVIDGISVLPMIRGESGTPHEKIFWEYGEQLAVREGRYKLVLNGRLDFSREGDDPVFLADLLDDPGERHNLAAEHPELVARLTQEVKAWYRSLYPEAVEN